MSEQQTCPHCGSVEFDLIKYERGHEGRGWFNRCFYCETEWDEQLAQPEREAKICRECVKSEVRIFELERALRDAAYHCHEIHRRGGTAWDCWYELQAKGKR